MRPRRTALANEAHRAQLEHLTGPGLWNSVEEAKELARRPRAMGQSDLSAEEQAAKADRDIEIWKIKKLIRSLEAARGCVHALSLAITQRRAALPFAGNTSKEELCTRACASLWPGTHPRRRRTACRRTRLIFLPPFC